VSCVDYNLGLASLPVSDNTPAVRIRWCIDGVNAESFGTVMQRNLMKVSGTLKPPKFTQSLIPCGTMNALARVVVSFSDGVSARVE
ncbi:MAG: hypothetical protein ACI8PT_003243, partial [Gammaproteobacteria bacterium]